jgi:hypothetical protein
MTQSADKRGLVHFFYESSAIILLPLLFHDNIDAQAKESCNEPIEKRFRRRSDGRGWQL